MEELCDDSLIISPMPKLEEQKSSMESDSENSNEWFELQKLEQFERQNTPRFDEDEKYEITITDMIPAQSDSQPSGEFIGTVLYLLLL